MRDLELLLKEDRREVAEQSAEVLRSGLARRVAGAAGRGHGRVWVPVLAVLALAVCVAVYAVRERSRHTPQQVAHAPVSEAYVPAPRPYQSGVSPRVVRVSHPARRLKKPLAPLKPFEVPGASREDERALLTLARAPSELQALALQQKIVLDDAYEKATEDFKTRTSKENSNDR